MIILELLHYLLEILHPILLPMCLIVAWGFIIMLGWSLTVGIRETLTKAKKMHQIPCTNCRFFTNDYHLKCTVQPMIANTEEAIECSDYRHFS